MIETIIAEWFKKINRTWNLKGGKTVVPNEDDIQAALDEAARVLYNTKPGEILQVGGLIIEKQTTGHDVYMYVGQYL